MSVDAGEGQEHQDIPNEFQEHLDLTRDDRDLKRKTPPGMMYYFGVKRQDKREFARKRVKQLNMISEQHENQKAELGRYHDPELVFSIKTEEGRGFLESKLAKDLQNVQVNIVSSAESNEGKWIVHSKDEKFGKLTEALKEYHKETAITFLDFIESFDKIPNEDKEALSIKEKPIVGEESITLDVELEKLKMISLQTNWLE